MFFSILLACSNPTSVTTDTADKTMEAQPELEAPENGVNTFEYDGLERRFRIHIPENLQQGASLVVVMHGFTSSARVIEGYSGMNSVADEHGFVVVYPQGTKDDWGNNFFNVGYDFHDSNGVDDIGFVHALIEHLQQSLNLSSRNVFSTGMSNGGDMSYMLACQSDVIRAIAPVAGCMMKHIYDSCTPTRPIPVLEIHGTLDDVTLVDGDIDNQEGWGAYMPQSLNVRLELLKLLVTGVWGHLCKIRSQKNIFDCTKRYSTAQQCTIRCINMSSGCDFLTTILSVMFYLDFPSPFWSH